MNKFSIVFLAALFLESMQKKNDKKESSTNIIKSEALDSEMASTSDSSSDTSVMSVKINPSEKDANKDGTDADKKEEATPEKKDDKKEEATPEKKDDKKEEANPEKKDDKKKTNTDNEESKATDSEKQTWKDEIKAIKTREKEVEEALSKVLEKAKNNSDDEKGYKECVSDLGQRIIDIESRISKARDMMKTFNEDVNKKKSGKSDGAILEDNIKKAKEETKYLDGLSRTLKSWKVFFCDHFFAICKKKADKGGKIPLFVAEKESSSAMLFYGGIAIVLCIAFFVLGYCFGGRKN
eukprot:jgi/Antlo1/2115/2229